jgi:outer membrane receptor protein involved in Fe transport
MIGAGNPRRHALATALAMSLGFTGVAYGQATTGTIFGTAPVAAGETVKVASLNGGTVRVVSVDSSGKFNVGNLPVGKYSVTLMNGDKVVANRDNVSVNAGGGTAVPFAAESASSGEAKNLGAIQVVANALPPIDVTSVNSSTIITSRDLQQLPVGRTAESIALLAPNTTAGSGFFKNTVSFGGSSVSENAYYVNGYNTGEPYKNIGGFSLPYGTIDQQQNLTGGYSAKYGRSDGGVINQIGKRGTNDWHFGGQIVWQPAFARASSENAYFGYPAIPAPTGGTAYQYNNPTYPGTLSWYRRPDKQWQTVYSAYAGGPLIKDRLYMFVAAETTRTQNQETSSVFATTNPRSIDDYRDTSNKYYAKLDWNINESNTIELTGLQNNETDGRGTTYRYDYNNLRKGSELGPDLATKDNARFYIGQYTGYYGDNATLSVLYGRAKFNDPTLIGSASPLPYILNPQNQCFTNCIGATTTAPAGNNGITNDQIARTVNQGENAHNATHGLRVDFTYKLGDHELGAGIDNMHYAGINQGLVTTGPNYFWRYVQSVNADGTRNYTVRKYTETFQTTMSTSQKAYYLQDAWQVVSNVQLNLGIRNDHFTNYNNHGTPFVNEVNQWEPRLGVSWDVNGDSTFKIYANAGRYYLALPDNAAERAANPSTYIFTRYTYTGVNPDGTPQNPVPTTGRLESPDGEFGLPKDPKQVTASNLKPEYLDEFILGFDKQLNDKWVYGAKATWRVLRSAIDDECQPGQIAAKMVASGQATAAQVAADGDYYDSLYGASYCRLINPGRTNTLRVLNAATGQYTTVSMSQQDWGYIHGARRTYGSLDMYMEHPWDGKWQARVDYEFNVGRGNTEGQVRSDFGQSDVSKTEDWDSWQLMQGQDGELLNVRRHQARFRGAYAITPEWLISGTAMIQSGAPEECLGYYGPDGSGDPSGYNAGGSGNYHWCGGRIVSPGFKHTPWTHQYNIGVHYYPSFAQHKLALNFDVFNILNEQKPLQTNPTGEAGDHLINNAFLQGLYFETPRYVRLSVSYDY